MNFEVLFFALLTVIIIACNRVNNDHNKAGNSSKFLDNAESLTQNNPSTQYVGDDFERRNYLQIYNVYCGPVYIDQAGNNVFYRLLEIPSEETVSLFAEHISMGDEGGNYRLISRKRVPEQALNLKQYNLFQVDSVNFIDSVTVEAKFNDRKIKLNLPKLD